MEILLALAGFALGGSAVFCCMLYWRRLRRQPPPARPDPAERQLLNFLNYSGSERGQMRLDD